jgi:hypothetical protein
MKKIIYLIVSLLFLMVKAEGQNMENRRISVGGKAPVFNWLSTNDSRINGSGVNLGYSIGAHLELPFNDNIYLTAGIYFNGNLGGQVRHEIGGNFWPNARLSNPDFNTGDKPLPNGSQLRYHINMLEFPVGFKFYTNYSGNTRYFFELPVFSLGIVTRSRGDINAAGIRTNKEIIPEETRWLQFSLGGGAGICYDLGFAEVYGGLYYQRFLSDLTSNNGWKGIETSSGITRSDEISRHIMNGLGIRLGVLF